MELNTKYGEVKIYAKTIEQEAISQIIQMANSPLGENAHIRIMPDCHAGAGCVIGTTMKITDKVCPNLVGVDIGCGVDLIQVDFQFDGRLEELDEVIRKKIPFGKSVHDFYQDWDFSDLRCWNKLDEETQDTAYCSLGTLGGGNHFIEAYEGGWLAVHSGSRNIGYKVAKYYQDLAKKRLCDYSHHQLIEELKTIEPKEREQWLADHRVSIDAELAYLTGQDMEDYLHDVRELQAFANHNRYAMLYRITHTMESNSAVTAHINSIHNYIDTENMILRKGAISAKFGEMLVIPLNMRDGLLLCRGKGNGDWNQSAPHGAGRLYSRSKAKENFTVEEYKEAMVGIYSSCINESTLDEAPFVYKDFEEIMECITPTVEILDRLLPIYNFKAN
jgi:RNA-splicing ligase RtcB